MNLRLPLFKSNLGTIGGAVQWPILNRGARTNANCFTEIASAGTGHGRLAIHYALRIAQPAACTSRIRIVPFFPSKQQHQLELLLFVGRRLGKAVCAALHSNPYRKP